MPMPKRRKGETEDAFISRFMSDQKMREEYPDEEQRLAVAVGAARKSGRGSQKKGATIFDAIQGARDILQTAYVAKSSGADLDVLRDLVRGSEMTVEKLNMLTQWNGVVGEWSANVLKNLTDLQSEVLDANLPIVKVSEEQRLVYAWASVIEKGGNPVIDLHGDIIEEGELVKAAHRSLRRIVGKQMHQGEAVAEVVESFVMTKEVQKMLDIDLGQVGWLVAMKIHDESVWQKVKAGELAALSIGGRGLKTEVNDV